MVYCAMTLDILYFLCTPGETTLSSAALAYALIIRLELDGLTYTQVDGEPKDLQFSYNAGAGSVTFKTPFPTPPPPASRQDFSTVKIFIDRNPR